jgi:hypothetical protein
MEPKYSKENVDVRSPEAAEYSPHPHIFFIYD